MVIAQWYNKEPFGLYGFFLTDYFIWLMKHIPLNVFWSHVFRRKSPLLNSIIDFIFISVLLPGKCQVNKLQQHIRATEITGVCYSCLLLFISMNSYPCTAWISVNTLTFSKSVTLIFWSVIHPTFKPIHLVPMKGNQFCICYSSSCQDVVAYCIKLCTSAWEVFLATNPCLGNGMHLPIYTHHSGQRKIQILINRLELIRRFWKVA